MRAWKKLSRQEKLDLTIAELQRISADGRAVTCGQWDRERGKGFPTRVALAQIFGCSMAELSRQAGLNVRQPQQKERRESKDEGRLYSRSQILDVIRSMSQNGYGPGTKHWDQHRPEGYPSAQKVRGVFDGMHWSEILGEVGLLTQNDRLKHERIANWRRSPSINYRTAEELKPLHLVHSKKPQKYTYYCTTRMKMITTVCYSSGRFQG